MCAQESLTLTTHSPEGTRAWGVDLGRALEPGQLVALHGELGAGKTTLTQGIAIGLGSNDRVTSPTFTLVNEYHGRSGLRILHMDGYRLGDNAAREAEASGIDELFDDTDAVVIVEWPERIANFLPPDHLAIYLYQPDDLYQPDENARSIVCKATGAASARSLRALTAQST